MKKLNDKLIAKFVHYMSAKGSPNWKLPPLSSVCIAPLTMLQLNLSVLSMPAVIAVSFIPCFRTPRAPEWDRRDTAASYCDCQKLVTAELHI
jgi:hypothetical protein